MSTSLTFPCCHSRPNCHHLSATLLSNLLTDITVSILSSLQSVFHTNRQSKLSKALKNISAVAPFDILAFQFLECLFINDFIFYLMSVTFFGHPTVTNSESFRLLLFPIYFHLLGELIHHYVLLPFRC